MFKKMCMNVVFLCCVVSLLAVGAINYLPLAGAQGLALDPDRGVEPLSVPSADQSGIDSYTKLMLHADGSDQGTSFTDSSSGAKTVTNNESYDSYTKLMLHMENNITDSATGKTVTNNNATFTSSAYKMGGYSGVFNGSNAYLSLADSDDWNFGSGDFTIDFWVRWNILPTAGQFQTFFSQEDPGATAFYLGLDNTGGTMKLYFSSHKTVGYFDLYSSALSLSTGTWYHIAIVKNGDNYVLYLDGVNVGTTTSSGTLFDEPGTFNIGAYDNGSGGIRFGFNGYIDELRISKGIARWTSNFTPPSSPYGKVYTVTGTKKFGAASDEFKGSGEYLSLADSDDWNFGSGDFTVDFWVKFNDLTMDESNGIGLVNQYGATGATRSWSVRLIKDSGIINVYFSTYPDPSTPTHFARAWSPDPVINTWYHIAVTRSSNTLYIFVNGALLVSSQSINDTLQNVSTPLTIGVDSGINRLLNGWLDEVRISKGVARWTSNFTPPTAPYDVDTTLPTVSSTSPASNATGVGVSSAISATFSEDMDSSTITTSTFTLSSSNGSSVSGTVSYSNKTTTFTPSSSLSYSTTYTATITTGVKDVAGNAMSSTYTWNFTTSTATATPTPTPSPGDTTAPTVTITSPTSSATYTTTSSTITLSGTASENSGSVSSVTWSNSKGGSGTASGTTNWTISGISLSSGDNVITVTATDGSGNSGTDTITVTYNVTLTPTPTAVPTAAPTPKPSPTAQPTPIPQGSPTATPAGGSGSVFGNVEDNDGNDLEGVTVTIVGANGSSPKENSTETASSGYYEFGNLTAGNYTLTYEKDGYQTKTKSITLEEGEEKDLGITVLEEEGDLGKIYGYVVDIKGDPIESVRLKLKGLKTGAKSVETSDGDGFFEFTDLGAGTYLLTAQKKRYRKAKQTIALEEGETKEIEIEMRKTTKRMIDERQTTEAQRKMGK